MNITIIILGTLIATTQLYMIIGPRCRMEIGDFQNKPSTSKLSTYNFA